MLTLTPMHLHKGFGMPYTPMPGPHPGEQFVPSNGFEGDEFIGQWCCNCARDKERVFCIAFVPAGQSIPAPRCEHTCDLFAQGEQP